MANTLVPHVCGESARCAHSGATSRWRSRWSWLRCNTIRTAFYGTRGLAPGPGRRGTGCTTPGAPLPQGGRPARLPEVAGWQDRVEQHVMEDLGSLCPFVQILDLSCASRIVQEIPRSSSCNKVVDMPVEVHRQEPMVSSNRSRENDYDSVTTNPSRSQC